jgi:GMP synthase-like glutamine amidotransferase
VKRALVIRHHVEDDAGLVGRALRERGFELETVMVDAQHRLARCDDVDVIVVLGSNNAVYDESVRSSWFNDELAALGQAHASGVAILGICFGAQALCVLFGGTVTAAPEVEEGWFDIQVRDGCNISPGPWFEYHGDHCHLPTHADVLARTDTAVQIFTVERHLGVQFHPEVDAEQLARWFASESPTPRAYSDRQNELLEQTRRETPRAAVATAALVEYFLRHAEIVP